jgi:hypothetical protein
MKNRAIRWVIPGTVFLMVVVAFFLYQSRGVLPVDADTSAYESTLIADRCGGTEKIDRRLLQQSWFYDPAFAHLAGGFGQTSFVFYMEQSANKEINGVFCINGTDLMVRYYQRRYVPVIDLSEPSVSLGIKLIPLGEDVYSVRELTKDRMILAFASDGREHVFFRKN